MAKVFAAGLMHESHGFSRRPTTLADYESYQLFRGRRIHDELAGSRTELGGMFAVAEAKGWDVIPGLAAQAWPSGPLTGETFEALLGEIVSRLRDALPIDGVFLSLHGSMSAEGTEDAEGEIIGRVRALVGPAVPISVSLDLHANVSASMAAGADALTSYRTTPHVDMYETGERAAHLLDRMIRGERFATTRVQWPMLVGLDVGRTVDPSGPMPRVLAMARTLETVAGIHDVSVCAGYSYADKESAGPSILVVADRDYHDAAALAEPLIEAAWQSRDEVTIRFLPLPDIVERMKRTLERPATGGPLIVADYSDGIAGGAYGDGTKLLSAMLEARLAGSIYGLLLDPVFVARAFEAGVGGRVSGALGGRTDPDYGGGPIAVDAAVLRLSDGQYVRKGPYATNSRGSLGQSALLDIDGVLVTVCSARVQAEDREQFRIFGIDPEAEPVLAFKGINHFRADFEPIAGEILFVDTGGLVSPDVLHFPYRKVRRPVWPLDRIDDPRIGGNR